MLGGIFQVSWMFWMYATASFLLGHYIINEVL